jgi:RNA polymerase sigma-70 factor (ECF subfamily)
MADQSDSSGNSENEKNTDDQPPSPEETVLLLRQVQAGDDAALNALLLRMLPRLRRWAHGRLPKAARGMLDTADIVQVVAAKAVRQLARLDIQQNGGLALYLRQAVFNEIASQWRRAARVPLETTIGDSIAADHTSPLDRLLGAERLTLYEAALARLSVTDQAAIVGRFEFAYDYEQLARHLGKPSAAAARVAVHRAVKRLTEQTRTPGL